MRLRFLLLAMTLVSLCSRSLAVDLTTAGFDQANKLFDQGKYAEAASAYQELLKNGQASFSVYFNLGNSYFKSGRIGRALAAYRQAERLSPRDPDLRANIQFARNQVLGPSWSPGRWEQVFSRLSLNEWTLAAASCAWLFFALLTLIQLRPAWKPALRNAVLALGLSTAVLAACLIAASRLRSVPVAAVVAAEASVRQGPLEESPTIFKVQDGAELRVMDRKDEWLQVTTDPRRIGWIKREQVQTAGEPAA
jgi:tetratricopeptide (TPR) repeat protein